MTSTRISTNRSRSCARFFCFSACSAPSPHPPSPRTMSPPRKASSVPRSKLSAMTMPWRPIPTRRREFTTCFRRPIFSSAWSSTATRRSIATRVSSLAKRAPSDGKVAQQVHIVDADGVPWEALYTLEQEADGSLKISGCVLIKVGQGRSATREPRFRPSPAARASGSAAPPRWRC